MLSLCITPRRFRRDIGVAVTDLDFADDIALLSNDVEQAQSLLDAVEKECKGIGLFLNDKKTKVLTCNTTLTEPLTTGNEKALEEVNDFKYPGSWVNSTEHDIKVRKALAWRALNSTSKVWNSGLSHELKRSLFVSTIESVLLCGCECWSLTSTLERSLDCSYSRMLRAALNINWQSHVLQVLTSPCMTCYLESRARSPGGFGLAGHCYSQGNLAGKLVLWEPRHGHRSRGRPPSTFIDTLKGDVGAECTNELSVCIKIRVDWRSRREARLWPPR